MAVVWLTGVDAATVGGREGGRKKAESGNDVIGWPYFCHPSAVSMVKRVTVAFLMNRANPVSASESSEPSVCSESSEPSVCSEPSELSTSVCSESSELSTSVCSESSELSVCSESSVCQ